MVTTAWQHQTHRRALSVFEQLSAALRVAPDAAARDAFLADPQNPYLGLLNTLYGEDFQLARVLDTSDLVIHAEGPALRDALPSLRAATWLCGVADRQLRHLIMATMDLAEQKKRVMARNINLRLTGLAPGSLYAGFKLQAPPDDLFSNEDTASFVMAREALQVLPSVPEFIGDEDVLDGIRERLPDPALRDASLTTALHLAPTGQFGIHTLGLSVPGQPAAELGQRERVVLRDALRRPSLANGKFGRFVGEVRELDMDKTRFHLRGVSGIGTLRCVLSSVPDRHQAKGLLGEQVAVSGNYATDTAGRPRLLLVDAVEVITPPTQGTLL